MAPIFGIFALDVGVPARPRPAYRRSALGWAGSNQQNGKSLSTLVNAVAGVLGARPVHLYLEAPLFLPGDPAGSKESDLCAMRPFEHSGGSTRAWMVGKTWPTSKARARHNLSWPWSGNAGGATLGMGLQELTWLLAQLKSKASGKGATLVVDTCPFTQPETESTDHSTCTCTPTESRSADSSRWRLTVLEAFHPQGNYSRVVAKAHGFKPLLSPKHVDVAERICAVARHFGGSPSCPSPCNCAAKLNNVDGVWFDSTHFSSSKTFNLVAVACWAAGVTGPACSAHGWVLCA